MSKTRWIFGDQLGPHFVDDATSPVLMVESTRVLSRRTFHRAKAHLVLSAMRHRAAELGERVTYLRASTYREAINQHSGPIDVAHPTSRAALDLLRSLQREVDLTILDARGFATSRDDFASWVSARGNRRLLLEDFYRKTRSQLRILMDGDEPAGGHWNFDHENREPPPKGASTLGIREPWWPIEDDIDAQVRDDLDRLARDHDVQFLGEDRPRRFPVTHQEAVDALHHFVEYRLPAFGSYEDAILEQDPWMGHSLLSVPLNLGLLDPTDVVALAEDAFWRGHAPIASVEGFVRQVIGWREYVWHLYWHAEPGYRLLNGLGAENPVPEWFTTLDHRQVTARCVSHALHQVAENGWVHHIPRLMVLGSYALQRGWSPVEVTDWFHRAFVDGYDWVMVPNVVGMSQHADGGFMATKPYTSAGAYLNRMSDHCASCVYDPRQRVGDTACQFTTGYWSFLNRHRETLEHNPRMRRAVQGLDRLADLDDVVRQDHQRGSTAP